jgi:hypothetical protein
MKYILVVIAALVLNSCCSTEQYSCRHNTGMKRFGRN